VTCLKWGRREVEGNGGSEQSLTEVGVKNGLFVGGLGGVCWGGLEIR